VRIPILLKIYTCATVQTYSGKFPLSYFQLAGWLSEYDCPVVCEAVSCAVFLVAAGLLLLSLSGRCPVMSFLSLLLAGLPGLCPNGWPCRPVKLLFSLHN
jgi:hypothetical protein